MRLFKKDEENNEPKEHERLVTFLYFLAAALAGYVLTNLVSLIGV